MRLLTPPTALAALLLAACGNDRPSAVDTDRHAAAETPRTTPRNKVTLAGSGNSGGGHPASAMADIPSTSKGVPAAGLRHPPLPLSGADSTLFRSPFFVLRTASDFEDRWKRAGGKGKPPHVDFGAAVVIGLRLPAGAKREDHAPVAHSVGGGTQVVLRAETPTHVGGVPTDRVEFYAVPLVGGPLARVRRSP